MSSNVVWGTLVGDPEQSDPKEGGIRRVNRKPLTKLADVEVEEFLMLVISVGVQKTPHNVMFCNATIQKCSWANKTLRRTIKTRQYL